MIEFDLKERNKEWVILAAVAIASIVGFYLILINPAVKEVHVLRERIHSSQQKFELSQSLVSLSAKLKDLESAFAGAEARPLLVGMISELAGKEKVSIQSVTPRTEPVGQFVKLQLEVDIKSSFPELVRYLKAIETVSPVFNVKDISLSKALKEFEGKKDPRSVQSKLILETLLLQAPMKS